MVVALARRSGHRGHLRQHVLNAMVELGHQDLLVLLGAFALGDVDVVAQNADRLSRDLIMDNASPRHYPSHLSTRANNAKLMQKSPTFPDCGVPLCFQVVDVVGMNSVTKV